MANALKSSSLAVNPGQALNISAVNNRLIFELPECISWALKKVSTPNSLEFSTTL